jgi:lysophospholipase L1-like esterase
VRGARARTLLLVTLAVLVVCVPPVLVLRAREPAPARILLVGDSVTQGSSGDWTWRYRLWKHLHTSGSDVVLVGPRDDLLDTSTGTFGSQEYVDPAFDRDHAARWGMSLSYLDPSIEELVRDHRPDVVVELLGLNDLVWQGRTPGDVADALADLVADARDVDPEIDVVLGELPQVWFAGVPELNTLLADVAEELDTESSRVTTAATGQGFVEDKDTYDPAHLAATGEQRVAAGVADALADLGIGSPYPRPLPQVANGPRQPAALTVRAGDGAAYLSWRPPPGSTGEYVWVRNRTIEEPWTRLAFPVADDTWTATGLVNGHDYELRLQSTKGTAVAEDVFSNVVGVRPGPQVVPPIPLPLPPPASTLVAPSPPPATPAATTSP